MPPEWPDEAADGENSPEIFKKTVEKPKFATLWLSQEPIMWGLRTGTLSMSKLELKMK